MQTMLVDTSRMNHGGSGAAGAHCEIKQTTLVENNPSR